MFVSETCTVTETFFLEVSISHIKRTHTIPVGLLCTGDQLVANAANYTTHNRHKRQNFIAEYRIYTTVNRSCNFTTG